MAKYLLKQAAFVNGTYYEADVRNPLTVELPDDTEPSHTWEPLDSAAETALQLLAEMRYETAKDAAARAQAALVAGPALPPKPEPKKVDPALVKAQATKPVDDGKGKTGKRPSDVEV